MSWISRNRYAIAGYVIFFLPALVVPAFIHDRVGMRGWIYFAWIFASPLAAFVGNIGKRRKPLFYAGIASLLLPIEIIWYLAYVSTFHVPDREKVAELYMPIIMIALMIMMPLGFALTYIGTRDT